MTNKQAIDKGYKAFIINTKMYYLIQVIDFLIDYIDYTYIDSYQVHYLFINIDNRNEYLLLSEKDKFFSETYKENLNETDYNRLSSQN